MVLMLLGVTGGCGWGEYDSRLQQSINERKSGGGGGGAEEEEEPAEDPLAEDMGSDGAVE
jgi:hypothetical protein